MLAGTLILTLLIFVIPIPSVGALREREVTQSTKIYDNKGETLLYEIYNEEKRTVVPFEEIPRNLKNATVAIEDSDFYDHYGIRPSAIVRAFFTDLSEGRFLYQSGSTITQQLVKNALLTPEKTLTRKIKEAVIALKIERVYSKDEILNLYLNEIPYGSNAYGIEAAAQTFFGKHARDLNLAESAHLAALPKAPSYYSPHGNHSKEMQARKNAILDRMEKLGYISAEETSSTKEEKVTFLPSSSQGIRAPHFVMYVVEKLNEQFGEDFIKNNGLKVTTTLDSELQIYAEETIQKYAPEIDKNFRASNTALIALDPKNGGILSMVGSRDYFDIEHDGNFNVTLALRQPGSAFKPIVYASAFERGYTPEAVLFDVPTEFAVAGADSYQPGNYDNVFRGPISIREALAQSINIPAVKSLYLTGIKNAIELARRLGITTLEDPSRYGLSLVLGGGEVKMLDLASAYSVFANEGIRHEPTAILRVEKYNGEVLFEDKEEPVQTLSAQVARQISSILSDNAARAPAFGEASALYFPSRQVAAKTGTTNDYRDAWIMGYTPSIVAGVWAGNNDNTPMEKRVAGFIVAPIWHEFMEKAFTKVKVDQFTPPAPEDVDKPILRGEWRGGTVYKVDKISGKLATESTPPDLIEERVIPDVHTILYWVDKTTPRGPAPSNPSRDSQFHNWEAGVQAWVRAHGTDLGTSTLPSIPTEFDDTHTEENEPQITILNPRENTRYSVDDPLEIRTQVSSKFPIKQTDYFLDDSFMGSTQGNKTEFLIDLSPSENKDRVTIRVKVFDEVGNTSEESVEIRIRN